MTFERTFVFPLSISRCMFLVCCSGCYSGAMRGVQFGLKRKPFFPGGNIFSTYLYRRFMHFVEVNMLPKQLGTFYLFVGAIAE